jgi:hypothetical protein
MNFQQGTVITLTAMPDPDSTFAGWPGDMNCMGTAPCTFTLNKAMTVQARFDLDEPVLTVDAQGPDNSGIITSNPSGISCIALEKQDMCTSTFLPGRQVALGATTFGNYVFLGWNAKNQPNCVGNGDCVITLNSNTTVGAVFGTGAQPTLSVQLDGAGSGSITSSPPGINCPKQACTASFDMNTIVTLTANPDSSSTFNSWSGAASSCGTNPTCAITINGLLVGVVATFDQIYVPPPPPFSLTSSPAGGATIPTGGSTAYGLTLVSFNGFSDTINLTCSVQPASSASPGCTFVPASVNLGANQAASSTLTISAGGLLAGNATPNDQRAGPYELLATLLMFSFVGGLWTIPNYNFHRTRRKRLSTALLIVLLIAIGIQVGCGAGSKSSGNSGPGNAQPGNYVVTVTAMGTMSQVSQTITIPVTVQ